MFTAIEVQIGRYQFRKECPTKPSGFVTRLRGPDGGITSVVPPEQSTTGSEDAGPVERVFLYNPLHDYESIWWIAVWFLFRCKPSGVIGGAMSQAWVEICKNRSLTFVGVSEFKEIYRNLPEQLHPLGELLECMRSLLVQAYRRFEKEFDGSEMLSVAPDLSDFLWNLSERAKNLDVSIPETHLVLPNRECVDEFDAVELLETNEDQLEIVGEDEERYGVGKEWPQPDDPFVDRPEENKAGEERTMGLKRRLSSPSVDPTARTRVKLCDGDLEP